MATYYQNDDDNVTRWATTNLKVGDMVEVLYHNYSSPFMKQGSRHVVSSVTFEDTYERERVQSPNGTFSNERIYSQKVSFPGTSSRYSAVNFKKVETLLSIETNRPTIVQEISESLVEGKVVVSNVGDPITLDSMSAARVFTTEEITKSIREKNLYRQFRIFQEHSVARAKKPEIEFA